MLPTSGSFFFCQNSLLPNGLSFSYKTIRKKLSNVRETEFDSKGITAKKKNHNLISDIYKVLHYLSICSCFLQGEGTPSVNDRARNGPSKKYETFFRAKRMSHQRIYCIMDILIPHPSSQCCLDVDFHL